MVGFPLRQGYNPRSMLLPSGARLGPYEVAGILGAGGMGEVEPICRRESAAADGSRQAKSRRQGGISC